MKIDTNKIITATKCISNYRNMQPLLTQEKFLYLKSHENIENVLMTFDEFKRLNIIIDDLTNKNIILSKIIKENNIENKIDAPKINNNFSKFILNITKDLNVLNLDKITTQGKINKVVLTLTDKEVNTCKNEILHNILSNNAAIDFSFRSETVETTSTDNIRTFQKTGNHFMSILFD